MRVTAISRASFEGAKAGVGRCEGHQKGHINFRWVHHIRKLYFLVS